MAKLLGFAGILLMVPLVSFGREVTDALGTRLTVPDQPQRVVSLIPSLSELAADLLQGSLERLAGVSEFSDYPPALNRFPSVGPYQRINLEKTVALRPDLILASFNGNSKDQVAHLRELKLPVLVVKTDTFEEVEESMRLVGTALGRKDQGEQMADSFKRRLREIRERAGTRKIAPSVLLQVGDHPVVVAGGANLLNEAFQALGLKNLYGDSRLAYPRPSLEDILRRRPEFILVLELTDPAAARASIERWNEYPSIPAVSQHRVYLISDNGLLRPTLRMTEGLARLEKRIWGSP